MSITYHEVSAGDVIEKLRRVLRDLPEVTIAVLFGSATRRKLVRDVDVGVCLSSSCDLKDFIKLAYRLEDALGVPVDLVPLRDAPPKLRLKILLNGIKLIVRDRKLFATMLSEALSEAVDADLKLRENSGCNLSAGSSPAKAGG